MFDSDVEQQYVYEVYSKLASHSPQSSFDNASHRSWPNVSKFVQTLEPGSVIFDVGCGPNKYRTKNCFMIGVDNCSEMLLKAKKSNHFDRDVIIGNALNLPFRRNVADAVLLVSVLHHFSTLKRRKRAIQQICNTMAPQSQLICYVWAKEQPYGEFESQDVLVPWNMHEISLNKNYFPFISFHRNSTREQRTVANSIPINVNNSQSKCFFRSLVKFVNNNFFHMEKQLPPAIPHFINRKNGDLKQMIFSGIHRWSPMLGSRLKFMHTNVAELYATELSQTLIEEAVAEALSTLRKVVFYRYYHVFKRGELEELIMGTSNLRVLSCNYDSANWCVFAETV